VTPVRAAGLRDRAAVAAMLARAFRDDPAMSFIYPDPRVRAARLPPLFALLFDEDADGMRWVTAGGEAATLWQAPGASHRPGIGRMLMKAWPMWRALGTAAPRALAVAEAIASHMPAGDHWYLHVAGCDPAAQGHGHGGRAIRAGLAATSGSPVYLETATEANLGLYRALGFAVASEWDVPGGGPHFWSMVRAAA
jgi:ribosomal protein S18 acetylase RimI-like enzyme